MRFADRCARWMCRALGLPFRSRAALDGLPSSRGPTNGGALSIVLNALGLFFALWTLALEPVAVGKMEPLSILRTGLLYALLAYFFLKFLLSVRAFYRSALVCDDEDDL